jgi:hypothetical protein
MLKEIVMRLAGLVVLAGSSFAVAGETETFELFDFGGHNLFPIQLDLLPEIEGTIINTNLELMLDVPEGTDGATLTVFATIPIVEGGEPMYKALNVAGADLGLSGSGLQSVDFDSNALNGVIADPGLGLGWAVGFGSTDGMFTDFGPATGTFSIEYVVASPGVATLLGPAWLMIGMRRRR